MSRRLFRVPEKTVQQQVIHLLRDIGAAVYVLGTKRARGDWQGTRQTPGIPDLWVFLPPRKVADHSGPTGLWIEVKADGGRLRPEQESFRYGCQLAGVGHVVGGVDEVVQHLVAGGWVQTNAVAHYRLPQTGT